MKSFIFGLLAVLVFASSSLAQSNGWTVQGTPWGVYSGPAYGYSYPQPMYYTPYGPIYPQTYGAIYATPYYAPYGGYYQDDVAWEIGRLRRDVVNELRWQRLDR